MSRINLHLCSTWDFAKYFRNGGLSQLQLSLVLGPNGREELLSGTQVGGQREGTLLCPSPGGWISEVICLMSQRKLAYKLHFCSTPVICTAHPLMLFRSLLKLPLLTDTFAESPNKKSVFSQSIPLPYPASFYFIALITTWHCMSIWVLSAFSTRLKVAWEQGLWLIWCKYLEQCSIYSRLSANMFWMNEWMISVMNIFVHLSLHNHPIIFLGSVPRNKIAECPRLFTDWYSGYLINICWVTEIEFFFLNCAKLTDSRFKFYQYLIGHLSHLFPYWKLTALWTHNQLENGPLTLSV